MSERVIKISCKENEVTINDDVVVFGFDSAMYGKSLWSSCAQANLAVSIVFVGSFIHYFFLSIFWSKESVFICRDIRRCFMSHMSCAYFIMNIILKSCRLSFLVHLLPVSFDLVRFVFFFVIEIFAIIYSMCSRIVSG